jgi:hypothetical protein
MGAGFVVAARFQGSHAGESRIVEIMLREVATLPAPLPWKALLDSS